MPWLFKEEIEAARTMTAIEYLRRYEGARLKKSSAKNEWELTDHDSFKINGITSAWHWKSRGIGGYNALDFLVKVDGMDFAEAVQFLSGQNPSYIPPEHVEKEKVLFVLPDRSPNCARVRKYLAGRGISDAVITYCIQKGILYESLPYHNAVFVGLDEQGKAQYAFLRGIYDGKGKPFRIEQAGSDKGCAFCIPPKGESHRAALYEASIDAMAHMTLEQGMADKYRLSLGGISAPKEGQEHKSFKKPFALERFLSNHPEIEELEICTDNDFAGRWACEHIRAAYKGKYRIISNLPAIEGADYGDLAVKEMKIQQRRQPMERGR